MTAAPEFDVFIIGGGINTALGAAWLAGSRAGIWPNMIEFSKSWDLERKFKPKMKAISRERKLAGWRDAVSRTLTR